MENETTTVKKFPKNRFRERKPPMINITINVSKPIRDTLDIMVKNGWVHNRSEYIRTLINEDLQMRYIEQPNLIDNNPNLTLKQATMKNMADNVIRLHNDQKENIEIAKILGIHINRVRRILGRYFGENGITERKVEQHE